MNKRENKEMNDLFEKETPKNIVISFLLSMLFGVAAGLAAIAYGELVLNFAIKIIYSSEMAAAQYVGFKRISQIVSLTTMLMGWVISFMIVWHKIEKKPSLNQRVKYGVTAIVIALALFGVFEIINYISMGGWLSLSGGIMLS